MSVKQMAALLIAAASAPAMAQATPQFTKDNGAPIGENRHSRTAGEFGGVMLEDTHLIEKLARFNRERIPERVVHARGTGAGGEFVVTNDITGFSRAAVFGNGAKAPVFVRFSTVIHPTGSPEALRDPRGFAVKFYTPEGNWDLVGNNLPIFFIRDAMQFPDMVHSLKPSPITNKQDPNRFFDFFSQTPESVHMLTQVYSDLGTPASYREMDGHGVHSYKLVNDRGETVFAKFQWKSRQGVKTLTGEQANAAHFNYATDDLYRSIAAGNFPQWDLFVKILKPADIAKLNYNPFDATKDWYGVPETKVGTMTLNKMPENFFEATEQSAFAPSNLVPGIEASPDRLLQGRLFGYADTQRYRLGANFQQLPINAPQAAVANNNQDGALNATRRASNVNYFPSRVAPIATAAAFAAREVELAGVATAKPISETNNFEQAGIFYRQLSPAQQANLIRNLSGDLNAVTDAKTKAVMVSHFYQADKDYGRKLAAATRVAMADIETAIAEYKAAESGQLALAR